MGFVRDAQRALPLVPGDEDDCCARLIDRTELSARDAAREWITFLRALGLAEETDSGFRRLRRELDTTDLAAAFRERVFGAEIVLDVLATDGPLGTDAVFERFREEIPNWERHRRSDWETEWRERVRRLLGWAVTFDLAERIDGEYRTDPTKSGVAGLRNRPPFNKFLRCFQRGCDVLYRLFSIIH